MTFGNQKNIWRRNGRQYYPLQQLVQYYSMRKKPKNFLITSTGRTGTKYLSGIMNLSKYWTVLHEPRGFLDDNYTKAIDIFYNVDFYGEVNSALIHTAEDFIEDFNVGVILRKPKDVILSYCNRRETLAEQLAILAEVNKRHLEVLELSNTKGVYHIDFDKMVTDKRYLNRVIRYFGISDIDLSSIDLSEKININEEPEFESFDCLPKVIKDCYDALSWHIKKKE